MPANRKRKRAVRKKRPPAVKRTRRARTRGRALGVRNTTRENAVLLCKSIGDPFTWKPPRLERNGQATGVFSLNIRSSFTLASGFGAIYMVKSSTLAPIVATAVANAGAAFSTGGAGRLVPFPQLATAAAQFDQLRVLSGGFRWRSSIAATNVPGQIIAGAVASTWNQMDGYTINDVLANPTARIARGDSNGRVLQFPLGQDDFFAFTADGLSNDALTKVVEVPYVAFWGLPANTIIYYEAVLHYEGLAGMADKLSIFSSVYGSNTKDGTYVDQSHLYSLTLAACGEAVRFEYDSSVLPAVLSGSSIG
jgi:hypothetical protein